jgi:hypothetical protein
MVGIHEERIQRNGKWEIVQMSSMSSGRKIVGNRLVYSEKCDGTLRSRTVAQGFSQVLSQIAMYQS